MELSFDSSWILDSGFSKSFQQFCGIRYKLNYSSFIDKVKKNYQNMCPFLFFVSVNKL